MLFKEFLEVAAYLSDFAKSEMVLLLLLARPDYVAFGVYDYCTRPLKVAHNDVYLKWSERRSHPAKVF